MHIAPKDMKVRKLKSLKEEKETCQNSDKFRSFLINQKKKYKFEL